MSAKPEGQQHIERTCAVQGGPAQARDGLFKHRGTRGPPLRPKDSYSRGATPSAVVLERRPHGEGTCYAWRNVCRNGCAQGFGQFSGIRRAPRDKSGQARQAQQVDPL